MSEDVITLAEQALEPFAKLATDYGMMDLDWKTDWSNGTSDIRTRFSAGDYRKAAEALAAIRRFYTREKPSLQDLCDALGYPWLPCPICKETEWCDHTVPDRARAAIEQAARR